MFLLKNDNDLLTESGFSKDDFNHSRTYFKDFNRTK